MNQASAEQINTSGKSTRRPLLIYRIFAYATGMMLLPLTVGTVQDFFFDDARLVHVVGPIHGFLYMGYVVATLILAERLRWRPVRALLVLLAGTVPLASFIAERKVTQMVRARNAVDQSADS